MPPLQVQHPTPSDIDIAQAAQPVPIATIAERLGLEDADYEPHGHLKAKVHPACLCKRGGQLLRLPNPAAAPRSYTHPWHDVNCSVGLLPG